MIGFRQRLKKSQESPSTFVVMKVSDFSQSNINSDLISVKFDLHISPSFAGIPSSYIAEVYPFFQDLSYRQMTIQM